MPVKLLLLSIIRRAHDDLYSRYFSPQDAVNFTREGEGTK